ncbi:MAG: glycosyltransferase [Verrucomicrobiae bacterium]|nr:glycosyltransferase [Verrucomicrobiae bacterium]MCP5517234.1 glycosyltransferase [Verrucomicrobiales bacterium]
MRSNAPVAPQPNRLSVVIPAFNEAKLITRCVGSVRAALALFEHRGEVVVCDNASTDDTAALARAAGALVVAEPKRQIARARNRGATVAGGEWLLFLDADSLVTPALFAELARALDNPQCIGGGAPVGLEGRRLSGRVLSELWNLISRVTRWAPGSFLFCRAAAFRELGGFNEELYVSEELDLSRRLKRLGRQRGQRMIILRRRFLTSDRKLDLYTPREALRFAARYLRNPRRVARDPAACPIWYDGRR